MLTRRDALVGGSVAALTGIAVPAGSARAGPVAADWQSLAAAYRVPDWFRDAKFGIWSHWGPQCQPERGDWYGRLMYVQQRQPWQQGETPYEHHVRAYGHPSRTGFIGTWEKLVRQTDLKFAVSNHSSHAWHWWQTAYGYDAEGPMKGRRYDAYWIRKHHGKGKYWDGLDPQQLYTGRSYVAPDGIESGQ